MSAVNDEELRYTFSCPSCGGSFSISLAKIPPVQARFSCPKCSKAMDFPSRDEARVFVQLNAGGGEVFSAPQAPSLAAAAPEPPPKPVPASPPPPRPVPVAPERVPPPAPSRPTPAPATPEAMDATGKTYVVDKKGFEGDELDRRAMRQLIRTGAINEADLVAVGGSAAIRADAVPELKSLFELRKTARAVPPPVCPKHVDQLAHYRCNDTGRALCEECAEEKKFGGASVRVCAHCGGPASELHAAPGDIK
jgi:predicted Zn finger-like uncharacterized protein